jgi:hypothetical protein
MDTSQIKPKAVFVVKRMWHNPEIRAYIDKKEVGAQMQINDFVRALTEEVYGNKSRLFLLSKAEFFDKVSRATNNVQDAMKETTAHIV